MSNTKCDRVKCVHNKMCNYLFELFNAQYTNVIDCNSYEEDKPQGEWIPISERLPNICGVYNVTKRVIDGGRCYYIADSCYFDGTGTWHDDNRINFGREYVNCIIAWQPLPEAYKEEIDNDE